MSINSPIYASVFALLLIAGCFTSEAQKTVYLSTNGKKSFSETNAIAKFEINPQDADTFAVYASAKNRNKWDKPGHQFSVTKKSDSLFHIFRNKNLKGDFRIRKIVDTTSIGFLVKEYNEKMQPVSESEALQVFPLLLHGESTVFDKDGNEMTHIYYLMGKQVKEEIIFSPSDPKQEITRQPEFPGGLKAFQKEIAMNITFPVGGRRTKTSGVAYIKFMIDTDGKMKNISPALEVPKQIARQGVKVIESIKTNWNPAENEGVKIPALYYAKVSFFAY